MGLSADIGDPSQLTNILILRSSRYVREIKNVSLIYRLEIICYFAFVKSFLKHTTYALLKTSSPKIIFFSLPVLHSERHKHTAIQIWTLNSLNLSSKNLLELCKCDKHLLRFLKCIRSLICICFSICVGYLL